MEAEELIEDHPKYYLGSYKQFIVEDRLFTIHKALYKNNGLLFEINHIIIDLFTFYRA